MARMRSLSRRDLLKAGASGAAALAGASLLPACSPAPAEPTKPAATAAPAKPAEPAKPTEVAKEAAKPAAPAPTAAAKPTVAAKAGEPKLGSTLVGKLEGPTIVTDPAKQPKKLSEAPELADQVKAGKLPAVAERVGEEPLVIQPVHEVGKYGGAIRRGFSGPADQWNGRRVAGADTLLWMDYAGAKIVPNVAKGWEVAPDGKAVTVFLRKGMKWSDGKPFTADDIIFYFEDIYKNKELVVTAPVDMLVDGKPVQVEKVDTYAVKYSFAAPYYFFVTLLASNTFALGGQALRGLEMGGGYAPAHYLKQFHPKYTPKEELDKKVKEAGFENWVRLIRFKNDWALNPELPVLTPWKTVTPINRPTWVLERNPYYCGVDTAGNQLPYVDKITMTLGENLEVINLRAIAGEYDLQERHIDLGKLPVLLENRAKGDYKVFLDPGDYGADAGMHVNLAYDADPEVAKWLNTTDFRRALSLGVDRDQLNETFWLGTGVSGSAVVAESSPYNPGPEYRKLWHTYEPQKANEMLDKLGLDKKDSEGYRLRADGKGRLRIDLMTYGGQFLQFTQIGEMVRQQWKKIGIDLNVREVERSLGINRMLANEVPLFIWTNDDTVPELLGSNKVIPTRVDGFTFHGNPHARWFVTGGKEGKAPQNPRMLEALEKYRKAYSASDAERVKLCKEIWAIAVDEVFTIGTVGLSPASQGVRVVKTGLGNVPERIVNNVSLRHPGLSRPATFYWKK